MTLEYLTDEDRHQLQKRYFQLWIVYKWMLIGMAVLFGGLWAWIGWEALHDEAIVKVFWILTVVCGILGLFGLVSTSVYRKNNAQGLKEDLRQNQKICKVGYIKAIERESEYADRCVFQENGATQTETLTVSSHFPDMYVLDREIRIEYSPHTRFILLAQLLVPLSETELDVSEKQETSELLGVVLFVGMLVLGMGWLFDILLVMTLIYGFCLLIVWGIAWQQRRKMRKSQNRYLK